MRGGEGRGEESCSGEPGKERRRRAERPQRASRRSAGSGNGLQPSLCTGAQPELDDTGLNLLITGPDYVTVGVPSSIECEADCLACTYSMSLDGQTAQGQGNALAFTVNSWVEALTVTCTATQDSTGLTATMTKRLQVLAGPADISISGPEVMDPTVSHNFSCHANCRPSCVYTWKTGNGPWISSDQGNTISVTPVDSKLLICKAANSVSQLFVTTTRDLADRNRSSRPKETSSLLLLTFITSVYVLLCRR
ncbi:hypothetical protein INR49_000666 [Caranx melampygus]|nr:hypothetical protein INR49_000666 [Caranx melampygus]